MSMFTQAAENAEAVEATRVRVVSAAIVREGRVLLAQRAFDTSFPLAWCTPGGKVEPGESDAAALRRELDEELGIMLLGGVELPMAFDVRLDPPTVRRPARVTCYRVEWCDVVGKPRPADGTVGLGWFAASDLDALPLTPSDRASRELLRAVMNGREPLVNVREAGDAGHVDGCVRDHLVPGVCAVGGEEVGHAG